MKKGFDIFYQIVGRLVNGTGVVGAFLFLGVMGITTYEVFMRYLFNAPTTWSLEISVIFTLWGTFFGVTYTLKQGGHTSVDLVINKLSEKKRRPLKIFTYLFMLLFSILLTWASFIPSIEAYLLGEVTQSYTRTPLYLLMFSIPIGGMLLILEILRELFEMFQRRDMKDMEEGQAPLL